MEKFYQKKTYQIRAFYGLIPVDSIHFLLITFLTFLFITDSFGEGTTSLAPATEDAAALYVGAGDTGGGGGDYGLFAWKGSDSKLFFNIQNTCERVYMGFSIPKTNRNYLEFNPNSGNPMFVENLIFRIIQPNGQAINNLSCFGNLEINGEIWQTLTLEDVNLNERSQVENGPGQLFAGGYDAIELDLSACGLNITGDYAIEFFTTNDAYDPNTPSSGFHIEYFDITVANCDNQAQNGRVWSNNWSLSIKNDGDGPFDRAFNGAFYVCSNEGFISKIDFNSQTNTRPIEGKDNDQRSGFRAGSFNVSFNTTGPANSGNIITDRLSLGGVNSPNPELAVFLNLPDENICPERPIGTFQQMNNFLTGCADSRCINLSTTQVGQVDILLERKNGNNIFDQAEEIRLAYEITQNDFVENPESPEFIYQVCIPWNGQDGLGNRWDINDLKISGFFSQGVYHFPAYDAEFNDDGFFVETVRPALGLQEIYYDDTQITESNNTGEPKEGSNGCNPPCHRWTGEWVDFDNKDDVFGNFNTINTWWFGNTIFKEFLVEEVSPLTINCPADYNGCFGSSIDPAVTGSPALLTSECLKVEFADIVSIDPDCVDGQLIERTWRAYLVDLENDAVQCVQTIKISGQAPPLFNNVPADITISCEELTPPPSTVTAISSCGNQAVEVTLTESIASSVCPNSSIIERMWTATDDCGNTSSATQTINQLDFEGPQIVGSLEDLELPCDAPTPDASNLNIIDNCDATDNISITFTDAVSSEEGNCGETVTLMRTYTLVDQCGNFTLLEQKIQFVDNEAPILQNVPVDLTVTCNEVPSPPNNISAVDNCDFGSNIQIDFVEEILSETCENSKIYRRTWTATDGCGNVTTETQLITTIDDIPPTLLNIPADITVTCNVVPNLPNNVRAVDNCDVESNIQIDFTEELLAGNCSNNNTYRRTWTATDRCGNASTQTQVITTQDNAPPVLANVPGDITVSCDNVSVGLPNVTATDNCDPEVTVVFQETTTAGSCLGNSQINRVWVATDICGNSTRGTQLITIVDTTPPQFLECGKTIRVTGDEQCKATVPISIPTAMDNCSGMASVTSSVDLSQDFEVGFTTVVFTATDNCGNQSTCTYFVEVDNLPVDNCLEDIVVSCDGDKEGATVSWEPPIGNDCCSACTETTEIDGYTYLGFRGGHRYYLSEQKMNWNSAALAAEKISGTLAVINDPAENAFLADFLRERESAFIGLSDFGSEGNFYWFDGTPLNYTNWFYNQPDNLNGVQHYGRLRGDGSWWDSSDKGVFYALIEVTCYDVIQTSGLLNGSLFEEGTTLISYEISYDNCLSADYCEFNVTVDGCPLRYCDSKATNANCFWIARIQLADLDHISGNDGGYADNTDLVANLTPGKTETILLQPGFLFGHLYDMHWTGFIDYNQDGDFDDEGEHVFTKFENRVFHQKGDKPVFKDFTIPESAKSGKTRMRIAMKFTEIIDPCATFVWGEVQDYTVNILPNPVRVSQVPEDFNTAIELEETIEIVDKEASKWPKLATNQASNINKLKLYPNPVRDNLTIAFNSIDNIGNFGNNKPTNLVIYHYSGKKVYQATLQIGMEENLQIASQGWTSGLYFVQIEKGDGTMEIKRFTKL